MVAAACHCPGVKMGEKQQQGLFSALNIFKRQDSKRSRVNDCIAVIGVTQAILIGKNIILIIEY